MPNAAWYRAKYEAPAQYSRQHENTGFPADFLNSANQLACLLIRMEYRICGLLAAVVISTVVLSVNFL
jgi:hypothetical protein